MLFVSNEPNVYKRFNKVDEDLRSNAVDGIRLRLN